MSWPEPDTFLGGVLALTVLGTVLPLEVGRGRQEHIVVTITATAQLAVLGARGLLLVWAAVAAGLVLLGPRPGRRPRDRRRNRALGLLVTAAAISAGFSLAYLVHVVLLGGGFPLDVSTSGHAAQAYLVLVVAWIGTMSVRAVAHRAVAHRAVARGGPAPAGGPGSDAFDPFESALVPYLLPTVGGGPVVVAAVAVYDPGDPWLSLAVLLWSLPLYAACRFDLHQRRLGQRLRREAEARRRLAAIGEVTARVMHQSRHHAGLMGWSLHRLRRLVGDPSPDAARAARRELDLLATVKQRLQASLEVDLLTDADPATGPAGPAGRAPGEARPVAQAGAEPVASVVREVAAELGGRAGRRGVTLRCRVEEASGAVAVAPGLRDAVLNLVDNAVDAAAGEVVVTVGGDPGGLRITVADDGPGLPAGQACRAFEPFFTTKPDGTGMGLPIAEAVVEELGGRLVHDREAAGATFVLLVPAGAAAPPPGGREREPELGSGALG